MSAAAFIGSSAWAGRLRDGLERVAPLPLPLLICGETGTGKEVVARELHRLSGRPGSFVPVDCGALTTSLVESELFGHERGAFTGANHRRTGLVAAADRGTFFLDEVGELPLSAQTRLLRLLQEGTYRPVGSQGELTADIRIVAATWRDLERGVQEGTFRRDLYHRLNVVEFTLTPLRDRPEDIDPLLDHFLNIEAALLGRDVPHVPETVRAHLRRLRWSGNARELRNTARYLVAMTRGGRAAFGDLPARIRSPGDGPRGPEDDLPLRIDLPYMEARREWLDIFQTRYVRAQLEAHGGNVSAAARASGMDRRSIQRILSRLRQVEDEV